CSACVRKWHIGSFRGDAAIRVASGAKRTLSEPRLQNRIYEYAPQMESHHARASQSHSTKTKPGGRARRLRLVGGTCARLLAARGVPVLPLDKDDIDLMASGAAEQLQMRLAPDDAILVVSARAPCKDTGMMVDNIRIMHAVCTALERSSVDHVVYF